ncbi:hypothetical protein G6F66_014731 [Rhizopus arrhizus]|nr:hypothetical protein G6F66_014731 [Rhizopus arrhizus]
MVHYRECLLRSPRLFDGVAEALAQLRARNVPLAICTNKPEALVPPLLQHLGIGDAFALVLGGDSLPQRKPSGRHADRAGALRLSAWPGSGHRTCGGGDRRPA